MAFTMQRVDISPVFLVVFSKGDGHRFPLRTLSECRNPLLSNERRWQEDGSDEDSTGIDMIELKEEPLNHSS